MDSLFNLDARSLKFLLTWSAVAVVTGCLGGWIDGNLGKVLVALAVLPALILATFFLAVGMPTTGWLIYNIPGLLAVISYLAVSKLTA